MSWLRQQTLSSVERRISLVAPGQFATPPETSTWAMAVYGLRRLRLVRSREEAQAHAGLTRVRAGRRGSNYRSEIALSAPRDRNGDSPHQRLGIVLGRVDPCLNPRHMILRSVVESTSFHGVAIGRTDADAKVCAIFEHCARAWARTSSSLAINRRIRRSCRPRIATSAAITSRST